ncbi:MAG: sigma-70 family RNA polymerase sigma factor, partial [Bacteroidetes bacterium]|nr:sigma-70 family RNA polymerase sigma factor [Bacteroidota bacterium]
PTPDRLTESSDFREHLERAIGRLDEPYRSLIVLREIHGLAYKELGETLDLSLSTTKVYLHRARKRLRNALQQTIPAEELTP